MPDSTLKKTSGRNSVIIRKLKLLEDKLAEIRSWEIHSFYEFQTNTLLRYAVERILQVCVEIIIDIGMRMIALEKKLPTENASEMLSTLEKMGVISKNNPYHKMVQFRNFIVHRYEYVDAEILYGIIKKELTDFDLFCEEIKKYQSLNNME
ncbi:MAG: DUF86 domain-containing protein [Candidatus Magnetomorum sp.]|nr:DUF86 domain-containing protein [Candidatus Magnetomorum sp.]